MTFEDWYASLPTIDQLNIGPACLWTGPGFHGHRRPLDGIGSGLWDVQPRWLPEPDATTEAIRQRAVDRAHRLGIYG